jgi:SAM-dependent methyltransferase
VRQDDLRLHENRVFAESFGSVAEEYDRYRPALPAALADDLAAAAPERVLDVACGTGRAARMLAGRGLSVLGVELDERMAEVARRHGIPVEVSPFETWDAAGRRFDLITCASAWHWIQPRAGADKAAELLGPGGLLARFWTYHVLDAPALAALDAVYRVHAPELAGRGIGHWRSRALRDDAVAAHPAFGPVEERTYRWEATLTADDWARMLATYSSHRERLGPTRLAALQDGVREAITALGGTVHSHGETYLLLARRADGARG